jgi:predicted Zn-dependent protease
MNMKRLPFFSSVFLVLLLPGSPVFSGARQQQDRNVSDALAAMDEAFASGNSEATAEDCYFIGRALGAHILSSYRPLENPALARYVEKVCVAITVNSPMPEFYNGYHIMILDSTEINAISSPGGHIFITRGLLELTGSEDDLAAIIAHEVAHIQLAHAVAIINRVKLTEDLGALGAASAATAAKEASVPERTVLFGNAVVELVNTLMKNGYSQALEYEADLYALALLAVSGYQSSALINMLNVLRQAQPGRPGGLYDTHPGPASRIAALEPHLAKYRTEDTRAWRTGRFRNK